MKKRKRDIKINFSNHWVYTFIILGIIAIISPGVYAYGTTSPSTLGHTWGEMVCDSNFCISSGVGIGTSNPVHKLDVEGNAEFGTGTSNLELVKDGQVFQIRHHDPNVAWRDIVLNPYGGNVGIGITNPPSSYRLAVSGSSNGIVGSSSSTGGVGVRGESPGTGVYGIGGPTGVTGIGSSYGVYGYGYSGGSDFYAAGPGINYNVASSIRWKDNVVEIPNALDKILNLRGVYFDWDKEHGGEHDMGMIAEEVGKYVPEIVDYDDATNRSNYYIENGERKLYATGIDYGALTPMLIEAIKEQQNIIKSQQTQINELKLKIEALEN